MVGKISIIALLILILLPGLPVEAGNAYSELPTGHWAYQALDILGEAGLTSNLPAQLTGMNRYEVALVVGDVINSVENQLHQEGLQNKSVSLSTLSRSIQEVARGNSGYMAGRTTTGLVSNLQQETQKAILALSDLRTEFKSELSILQIQDTVLDEIPGVNAVRVQTPASGGVVTGSTNSEDRGTGIDFAQRYNLLFNANVSEDVWAQAEVSGEFGDIYSGRQQLFPELSTRNSTPLELERVELFVDKDNWNVRVGNRLQTTLDRYTLYDQEVLGAEAQMMLGKLGTTVVVGQNEEETMVTALNSQLRLTPNFQVGGTIVSAEPNQADQRTNYGVNSYLRVMPGLEIGGQYYVNGELHGGTALEVIAWTELSGIKLKADFTEIDANYSSPLAAGSADTYIPGSRGYNLTADTSVGKMGLSAEYEVKDYEIMAEQAVTRGVSATMPLIPGRLDLQARYHLVDVDALYSPDYSSSIVNLDSNVKLTDKITLKAGYEVSQDSNQNSSQSVNANVALDLSEKAKLNADVAYGRENGYFSATHREAGMGLGYSINENAELTAHYRLINFDSSLDSEDHRTNVASAELRMNF